MGNIARRIQVAIAAAALATAGAVSAAPATAAPDAGGTAPPSSAPAASVQNALPGQRYSQFIAQYRPGPPSASASERAKAWGRAAQRLGVSPREVRTLATGATLIAVDRTLDDAEATGFMNDLAASGAIEYVEPDARMTASLTPNDPGYPQQWDFSGTNGMRIPGAWDVSTGTGAVVAVLDTGITAHPDLDANVLPGYDFVSDPATARDGDGRDPLPRDEGDWYAAGECGGTAAANSSWHGTHVAGTVAAVTGNATGVAGTAPDARVEPLRVLGKCGGMLSDIADAIVWAAGGDVAGVPPNLFPAAVVNMSLGGPGTCGATYQNAIDAAVARGTTVVVAAGNEAQDAANVRPGNCANVVTVAASNPSGGLSYYSNYGASVDLTAPGGDVRVSGGGILSTLNTGKTVPADPAYAFYQGTSMAAPHVAGLAALLKSANPSLTPAQVESTLKQGTRPLPGGCSLGCGAGLSDATATVALIDAPVPAPNVPAVVPWKDYTKDGKNDVVAIESGGTGWVYPGNGTGGWLTRISSGTWTGLSLTTATRDLDGDGISDLVARDTNGTLWLYPGNGTGGWKARTQLATALGTANLITAPGDFTGDGKSDLLVRDTTGALWLYPGTGTGTLGTRTQIGWGWDVMNAITSTGDFNGDGKSDILARDANGALWLYPGTGTAGFGTRTQVGSGWSVMNAILGIGDFNGDGKNDILARDTASGGLYLYPGNGTGGWLARTQVGWGWNGLTLP
ncbi:S8 family serine peptidase [Sinomonas atrocyanea]|uniref:S8 family serine peptidase n=1 Tax=Sinomonas atrocyanea TaxID=37927 RepID=UPI003D988867